MRPCNVVFLAGMFLMPLFGGTAAANPGVAQKASSTPGSDELVIVAPPSTGLREGQKVEFGDNSSAKRRDTETSETTAFTSLGRLSRKPAHVVVGKAAADAAGAGLMIVVLEEPKTIIRDRTVTAEDKENWRGKVYHYNEVTAIVPVSIWYRDTAEGKPQLLGRSFVWNRADPLEREHDNWVKIYKDSDEAIKKRAVLWAVQNLPMVIDDATASSVIASKPLVRQITMDMVVAQATRGHRNGEVVAGLGTKAGLLEPRFRFSRTSKDDQGRVVLEVDVFNRHPVRAVGSLRRKGGPAEEAAEKAARDKITAAAPKDRTGVAQAQWLMKNPEAKAVWEAIYDSGTSDFDLAPGEKTTLKMVIPKELTVNAAVFADSWAEPMIYLGKGADARAAAFESRAKHAPSSARRQRPGNAAPVR